MYVVALTHTEGVVLYNNYVVLELAYTDVLGTNKHFLLKSPTTYAKAKKYNKYLDKSLEVIMCVSNEFMGEKVYKFYEVLQYLKNQYSLLQYYFGNNIKFGYKGKSFQKDILKKCNIPSFNIEQFGVPAIWTLISKYPHVQTHCVYHKNYYNKCAKHILRLLNLHLYTSSTS